MDCDGIYGLASKSDNMKDKRTQIQKNRLNIYVSANCIKASGI